MRTTLNLPKDLIDEAMSLTGATTKTALITQAIEEIIRKIKLEELTNYFGKLAVDIDLNALIIRLNGF
jgi:hypothetical protein